VINLKIIPDIYVRSIFDISYHSLKKQNIKCLIFDLDNTLALLDEEKCPRRVEELIKDLKKDFQVFIITNSVSKRANPYRDALSIEVISMAMKPFTKGLRVIKNKYGFKKEEMIMIGDQLMTDILSGVKFGIKTILVDPIGVKDLKITKLNRVIEKRLINKYKKIGLLERGKYYE